MSREYVAADEVTDFAEYVKGAKDTMVTLCREDDELFWNVYVDYLGNGPEDMVEFHFKAKFIDHMVTKQEADWLASGRRVSFYVHPKDVHGDNETVKVLVVASLQPSGLMTKNGSELLFLVAEEMMGKDVDFAGWRPMDDPNEEIVPCVSALDVSHGVIFGQVPDLGSDYVTARSLLRELVSGLRLRVEEALATMRADIALPSYYMESLRELVGVMLLRLEDGEVPAVHEVYKVAGSIFKHLCRLGDHGCAEQFNGLTRNFLSVGLCTGEVACDGEEDEKIVKALGL